MKNQAIYDAKIKLDLSDHKVIWPIVIISIARGLGLSEKVIFILGLLWIGLIMLKSFKIIIPRVSGLWFYCAFIGYSTAIGLICNHLRYLERDVYYFLPTVVAIILGYYLAFYYGDKKDIIRTICLSGASISFVCFVKALKSPGIFLNFNSLKGCFGNCVYEICIALVIVIYIMFICRKEIFNKKVDYCMLMLMLGQVILCLSRAAIIQVSVELVVIIAISIGIDKKRLQNIKPIFIIIVSVITIFVICITAMPKNVSQQLLDKFAETTTELDSKQEFNSSKEAMNNWRGYEIQEAKKQWNNSNVFVQMFGNGMGKGVRVAYVPYSWSRYKMLENSEVPLLHNGYYTILPKGGLIGIASILWLFLSNIIKILKKRKSDSRDEIIKLTILCFITLGIAVNTYVVRGPVTQTFCMFWGTLLGWLNQVERDDLNINIVK